MIDSIIDIEIIEHLSGLIRSKLGNKSRYKLQAIINDFNETRANVGFQDAVQIHGERLGWDVLGDIIRLEIGIKDFSMIISKLDESTIQNIIIYGNWLESEIVDIFKIIKDDKKDVFINFLNEYSKRIMLALIGESNENYEELIKPFR